MKQRKLITPELQQDIEQEISREKIPYTYDTKEYPVEVIVKKFNDKMLYVPDYQRNYVWSDYQQSRFIESVFLGVPIMPFLVSITKDSARLEIVDGSQRIRTLNKYCNNELTLKKLEKLRSLNDTNFSDLTQAQQNKFMYRDFRFHVVTDKATSEIRADIFNRVNTSPCKLTASETRKGAYQGPFYNFILECSHDELFRTLCPMPQRKIDRGEYEELVLRFFVYSDSLSLFKHDVSNFLDDYVKRHQNNFDRDALKARFDTMCNFVYTYFQPMFFGRRENDAMTPRVRFEAISVGVWLALQECPNLQPGPLTWLNSIEFKKVTTSDASNSPIRLKARIEFVRDCLLGRLNDLHYANSN